MARDQRLARLMTGISEILGVPVQDENSSVGDLGIDSESLFEVVLICQDIYGNDVDFDRIEVGYNTTLRALHEQLLRFQG
jgi:acyl carrier protein